MASAQQNHSPVLVLGGRAPAMRWGQGSLQEIDHVPFVRPLVKLAATAGSTAEIPGLIDDAWGVMQRDHPGPAFLDFPLDVVFMEAEEAPLPEAAPAAPRARRRGGRRPRDGAAARRRPPGDHGRHEPLLGPRRGRAARARRGGGDPGVPQRPRARLPARRPPAVLLARAQHGAQGRRRGARDRRADGLPARLRRRVRRGDRDRRDRPRRARARPPAPGGGRVLRRHRRRRWARWRAPAGRATAPLARAPARRRDVQARRASASCSRTTARRCTRCASTASSRRCSTATRS